MAADIRNACARTISGTPWVCALGVSLRHHGLHRRPGSKLQGDSTNGFVGPVTSLAVADERFADINLTSIASPQLPEKLPLNVEGELRIRLCVALATREDERLSQLRQSKQVRRRETSRIADCSPLPWMPKWSVIRGHDAFPGQDFGRPVPIHHLGSAKRFCETKGLAGMVLSGGFAYLRSQTSSEVLRAATTPFAEADLLLRGTSVPTIDASRDQGRSTTLRVAVLATQDEFDETSLFDVGMVCNTGNGRRYAAQALLRELSNAEDLELTAVLLYDWKNGDEGKETEWPLLLEGPERVLVAIRGGTPISAWRGSMGQLLGVCAGELQVDIAISIQARTSCLELMHQCMLAKHYLVMGHDYNLPYGPWGMEVQPDSLTVHRALLEDRRTSVFCTSQHLADFINRFSQGNVHTDLCYCADYGYFDQSSGNDAEYSPPNVCNEGDCVTVISPCSAKGLSIVLRLAMMMPDVKFLCVSTGWTKTLHEVQLAAHPNVEIITGSDDVDSIYRRTAVLLVPSLWTESFGLVAVEAQLRGVPVVSSGTCGLNEANFIPELRVQNVRIVHDSRTREMHRGITMEEAEQILDPARPGHSSTPASVHQPRMLLANTVIATEDEASGFYSILRTLVVDEHYRQHLGNLARERAVEHCRSRRKCFLTALKRLASSSDEKTADERPSRSATHGAARAL